MADERNDGDEADDPEADEGEDDETRGESAGGPDADEPDADEPSREVARSKKTKAKSAASEVWEPHPIVSPWAARGLATLSAVLCPLAFAGFDIWPLAFIAWVPLLVALRGQSPKKALLLGWYAGFGMTMIGFYWLTTMLEEFSGFPLPLCVLFAAILCIQKGGRIALCAWLYARAAHRGWHPGLTFLGAFAVSELVYPLLFPWYFAASLQTVPVMMQTADLGGPILVSLVILAFNVAIAELLEKPVFHRRVDRRTVALAAAPLIALAYGAIRVSQIDAIVAEASKIRVGMVQGASPLKGGRSGALRVHLEATKKLREENVDLVVWSEAASATAFREPNYEKQVEARITRQLKVPSIVGIIVVERIPNATPKGRKARLFNTAVLADENGTVLGRYDKQYLLMFGEYLPLGETFPVLYEWSPNSGNFTPGSSFASLHWGEHRLATMICYEDILPSFVSKMVNESNPDLLVNMTNDTWFGDTVEPWQHLALAKFRSIEHRLFMVRVTNTGVSAIIDPVGRTPVVIPVDLTQPQTETGEVAFLELFTIYKKLGDVPWWIVTGLMLLAAFVRRKPKTVADEAQPTAS
jgi:apolipoprotein N-acyltransferase